MLNFKRNHVNLNYWFIFNSFREPVLYYCW